ncbi:MAG: Eco57I restriction-modification methylase domain-containing protein [Candidatus Nanohaloarchaea archaeon]
MSEFLSEFQDSWREWEVSKGNIDTTGFYIGEGSSALEVAVGRSEEEPRKEELTKVWKERKGRRAAPVLLVVLYGDRAAICGPTGGASGDEPPIRKSVDSDQITRICTEALEKPNRHAARDFLWDVIEQIDDELIGIRNQGLVATHELKTGVKNRSDWSSATEESKELLGIEGRELIEELGYDVERLENGKGFVLKDGHRNSAVAIFLEEDEDFEISQERFSNNTPVNYALNKAEDAVDVDWVIASSGKTLRLYTTDPDKGLGSRGRTDTYVEVNSALLPEEDAGYLSLMFSPEALRDEGSLEQIIQNSEDYATDLGGRLRERIYDDVVPDLAEAIADARDLEDPSREELDETYEMSIILLYRLLFIAYAEDEGYLPRKRNERYDRRSLKEKAKELNQIRTEGSGFDPGSTSHWEDITRLANAIHDGQSEWGVPEYDGQLLSSDPDVSEAGAKLAELELSNDIFGPILANLLIDKTSEGYQGPVDFRNIGVRDFGTIYQGLLESELSVADQHLGIQESDGEEQYVPVEDEENAEIKKGEIYLHGTSGERKATGTYYTKSIFVEHLLDHSLDPAIEQHLDELDEMSDAEAAENFFDFRVADIAMGSGHFLVGAVDRIESKFSAYLAERPLPEVEEELDNLQQAAKEPFENEESIPDIERSQLLRRQIARRCVYGVDLNPLSTELARLSMWIHTFVPGLPLTFLNHNLVTGDSLSGIGTMEEAQEILKIKDDTLAAYYGQEKDHIKDAKEKVEQLGSITEAHAEEVVEARETQAEIEKQLDDFKALLDILAASRVNNEINADDIRNKNIEDLKDTQEYSLAQETLEATNQLHFPIKFPEIFGGESEGFDVILGNPPWEETIAEEDAFFTRYRPGLTDMPEGQKREVIENLKKERPDLAEKFEEEKEEQERRREILKGGPFPGMGTGDPDMYKAFYWRFWSLSTSEASIGVVLPRNAFFAKGSKNFREKILEKAEIEDLTILKNKDRWIFDITPVYTAALSSFTKREPDENTEIPIRGPYTSKEEYENRKEPYRFPVSDAKKWTNVYSFPNLPVLLDNKETVEEAFEILNSVPKLDYDEEGEWRALPYRELDESTDKTDDDYGRLIHLTEEPPEDDYWPVFDGSSTNYPGTELWVMDRGSRFGWSDPDVMLDYLQESRERSRKMKSHFSQNWIHSRSKLPCKNYRVCVRNAARVDNLRSVVSSLIPKNTFITNAIPYFLWPRGDETDMAYLMGILNSVPLDWYARRFVEANLNYFILNAFPVPRPGDDSEIKQEIAELSARLACKSDKYEEFANRVGVECGPIEEEEEREKIRELDALVAKLYGLKKEHLEAIFDTFHEVSNPPEYWESKKHDTLEFFDEVEVN